MGELPDYRDDDERRDMFDQMMEARFGPGPRVVDSSDGARMPVSVLRLFGRVGAKQLAGVLSRIMDSEPEFDRFPVEPPDGAVLRYQKTFPHPPGKTYTYIALRAGGRWFRTGKDNAPIDGLELKDDIANWPCHVATAWGEIPQAPEALFDGLDPADWFREVYQSTVTVDADSGKEANGS